MSKNSVEILNSILEEVKNMSVSKKSKISEELNEYVKNLYVDDYEFLFDYTIFDEIEYEEELSTLGEFYFAA